MFFKLSLRFHRFVRGFLPSTFWLLDSRQ